MSEPLAELFATLAARDVRLWVEDGALRFRAPKGALTAELKAVLQVRRAELVAQLTNRGAAPVADIPRVAAADDYPLSPAQRRLWVLAQMGESAVAYHIPLALELMGPLDVGALEAALTDLVGRHEALRTVFLVNANDEPRQRVLPPAPVPLPLEDLSAEADPVASAQAWCRMEGARPFDLVRGPLLRASLLRLGMERHVLALTLHHIIADGTSLGVLVRELGQAYHARVRSVAPDFKPLPVQYRDYAAWQLARGAAPEMAEHAGYWRQKLAGVPPALELPTDRPRSAVQTFRGRIHSVRIDGRRLKGLRALGGGEQASLFMVLVALVKTWLRRTTGQEDIVVASPIAGREHADLEGQIGFYLNTLVLRDRVPLAAPFLEVLRAVRGTALEGFAHQAYSFDVLINELNLPRDVSRSPLADVFVILQNTGIPELALDRLTVRPFSVDAGISKFDLTFDFQEVADELYLGLEYNCDLFDADRIARTAAQFITLVDSVLQTPATAVGGLELLPATERALVTDGFNGTAVTWATAGTVVDLIATQAALTPEVPAVRGGGAVLTYRELTAQAEERARRWRELGAGPGVLVAVCLERNVELVVALLAVLKTGAAYVPLDPSFPRERLRFMLEDSCAALLVTGPEGQELARPGLRVVAPGPAEATGHAPAAGSTLNGSSPGSAAYVIYTSGSTGRPKGVQVLHRGLTNLLLSLQREPGIRSSDTLLAVTTVSFDIAALELWLPLISGACVAVADRASTADGAALLGLVHTSGASILQATPATWRMLLAAGWGPTPGLRVWCGGEALPGELAAELLRRSGEVWNLYGPTETTIWSTAHRVTLDDTASAAVPIGRPIANTRCLVLDARMQPVPVGVAGELHLGGEGVTRGYWRRAELTADRFVPDPFSAVPGARLYRTGDQARWRSDGTLEYLGRLDQQVKLRGYRIELGEIEAAIAEDPAVVAAVVALRRDRAGGEALVGYVVPRDGATLADDHVASARELTAQWNTTWDETYRRPGDGVTDETFDLAGWNSSYTGSPIPATEMREWLEDTVERVRALRPRRVLELGCGSGLLLFRLGGEAADYWAVDFSRVALLRLRTQAAALGWHHVRFLHREAADFSDVPAGAFDTVILNSVVQYFPSPDYLLRVIEGALRALAPGGALFIGDVRCLPLLRHYHASVQLARAPDSLTREELRVRVETAVRHEEELVLDPAFFVACRERFPRISSVAIELKMAAAENELSRFRCDVTLRVDEPAASAATVEWRTAGDALTAEAICGQLQTIGSDAVGWRALINPRLHAESRVLAWLDGRDVAGTVGELRRSLGPAGGLTPAGLAALASTAGRTLTLTWSPGAGNGEFDAVFARAARAPVMPLVRERAGPRPWSEYATDPLKVRLTARLGPMLTARVAAKLPAYMVPSVWVLLDALPLTANGKVDRRALPAPDAGASRTVGYVAPRDEFEAALANLWTAVLGVLRVGVMDSFFELGGHSLKATQLVARVKRELGAEISIVDVFQHPTVAALAGRVRVASSPPTSAPVTTAAGPAPLSAAQRRLWILEEMRPGTAAYNLAEAVRLEGELVPAALRAAFVALVDRHETLRTVFAESGDEVLAHATSLTGPAWAEHDVSAAPDPEAAACALVTAEAAQPFDLRVGPLVRATLVRLGPQSHVLVCVLHHIVTDALSQRVLLREFAALYRAQRDGRPNPLPPLRATYGDYAARQLAELAGTRGSAQRAYWLQKLGGGVEALALPLDAPRPAMMTAAGRTLVIPFEPVLWTALTQLGRSAGATPFMTLLALVKTLLHRYTGQEDIVIGSPIAGREGMEWEESVGFFVNTLALRNRVSRGDSFAALLTRVRATCLEAYANQAYPFDRLVDDLRLERDLSRNPLYDVSLQLLTRDEAEPVFADLRLADFDHGQAPAKCDLSFDFSDGAGGLVCALTYHADLFSVARMRRLAGHLQRLAAAVVADPSRAIGGHDLLTPGERDQIFTGFNPRSTTAAVDTIPAWFGRVAGRHPAHAALRFGGETWTYGELEARANQLAQVLRARGVGRKSVVAVMLERGTALPLALLAAMKAGAIYLPLDPALPAARIATIAADGGAALAITSRAMRDRVPPTMTAVVLEDAVAEISAAAATSPGDGPTPADGAYLIYTSGSTGTPKGVLVEHRGAVNTLQDQIPRLGLSPADRVSQFSNASFDFSILEILGALLSGATLVLTRRETLADPALFRAWLRDEGVTVTMLPPSFLRSLEQAELPVRMIFSAGEAAVPADARHYAARLAFFNGYGPTEVSILSSVHHVAADEPTPFGVPIGRPLANTATYLLDAGRQPVPIGVPGELWIGGMGVSRGYWRRPELTAERYVPDPFSGVAGARMYRSGDLGRWREDGAIEFLGRADRQVKLRGYRIELDEIELALARCAGVREAVVLLREDEPGHELLVGYVRAGPVPPDAEALRGELRTTLPDYMVPAAFVILAEFPLSAAGKINRRALPPPALAALDTGYVAPRDEVEQAVAEIFCTVLRLELVGAHDRFFHLGGNSLLAMQVISRVRDRFRVDFAVTDFFAQASVAGLAGVLRANPATRAQVDRMARAAARLAALSPEEKQKLLAEKRAAGRTAHG